MATVRLSQRSQNCHSFSNILIAKIIFKKLCLVESESHPNQRSVKCGKSAICSKNALILLMDSYCVIVFRRSESTVVKSEHSQFLKFHVQREGHNALGVEEVCRTEIRFCLRSSEIVFYMLMRPKIPNGPPQIMGFQGITVGYAHSYIGIV